MLAGVELLRAYRQRVAEGQADHPDLPGLDKMIAFGEAWDPQIIPSGAGGFSPEQYQGLESIGFTFAIDIQALSLGQLSQDPISSRLFDYITDIEQLRNIAPTARQVAVNPKQPYVEGSQDLGYDDQREMADRVVRNLRGTCLKKGTLEGVDFTPDKASVLSQLDFAHQARFNGQKLYPDYFIRSEDEYDHPRFGPSVTLVGRSHPSDPLIVRGWFRSNHFPGLGLSLVATPSGSR